MPTPPKPKQPAKRGRKPADPARGKKSVRVELRLTPDRAAKADLGAFLAGISRNEWIERAIDAA